MNRKTEVMDADRFYEIDTTLERIREIWMAHPELRLGQLISNVKNDAALYFIEDDHLIEEIERRYLTIDESKERIDDSVDQKGVKSMMQRYDLLRIAQANGYNVDCNDLRIKLFRGERYTEDVNLIEIAEDVVNTLYFSTEKCDEKDLIVFGAAIEYAKTGLEYR